MPSFRLSVLIISTICLFVFIPLCQTSIIQSSTATNALGQQQQQHQYRISHLEQSKQNQQPPPPPPVSSLSLTSLATRTVHRHMTNRGTVSLKSPASPTLRASTRKITSKTEDDPGFNDLLGEFDQGNLKPVSRVGRCLCPVMDFEERYARAYATVRCTMIEGHIVENRGTSREVVEYVMETQLKYRGPKDLKIRNRFKVRSFSNTNICGLRFQRKVAYLLYLTNPDSRSIANPVPRDVFEVDQCSKVYKWRSLSNSQRQFLRSQL